MPLTVKPAAFAVNGSLSGIVTIADKTIVVGLIMPSVWTAANATVQVSADGVTFYDLYEGMPAKETMFNVRPGVIEAIDPDRLLCCMALKIRSGTGASPVPQKAVCQFGVVVQS
jgi:hypothetical protein